MAARESTKLIDSEDLEAAANDDEAAPRRGSGRRVMLIVAALVLSAGAGALVGKTGGAKALLSSAMAPDPSQDSYLAVINKPICLGKCEPTKPTEPTEPTCVNSIEADYWVATRKDGTLIDSHDCAWVALHPNPNRCSKTGVSTLDTNAETTKAAGACNCAKCASRRL